MFTISKAKLRDIPWLPEIEKSAAGLFDERDLPVHCRNETLSLEDHANAQRRGLLWVATDGSKHPVGFVHLEEVGTWLHLVELDVAPTHQRLGTGTALLQKVIEEGQRRAYYALTLTTNRYVPWNAPWYAKHGFEVFEENQLPDHVAKALKSTADQGFDSERRIGMQLRLRE